MSLARFLSFGRPSLEVPIHHVLRADATLQGRLTFKGGLDVQGRVEGDLVPTGPETAVVVGPRAEVKTSVLQAKTLIVHGQVQAERIEADRVVLTASARVVCGDLRAQAIETHPGAAFEGRVALERRAAEPAAPAKDGSAAMARNRLEVLVGSGSADVRAPREA